MGLFWVSVAFEEGVAGEQLGNNFLAQTQFRLVHGQRIRLSLPARAGHGALYSAGRTSPPEKKRTNTMAR
jgi:hypothetical protein